MEKNRENRFNVILVAWSSAGGWSDVRAALTRAFRNFFPDPGEKQGETPYDPFEGLAEEVLPEEEESKVVYSSGDPSAIDSKVRHAVAEGARQIIVAPLLLAVEEKGVPPLKADMGGRLRKIEKQHPGVEILFAGPPFGSQRSVERLLQKIREHEPEAADLLEKVVERGFHGDWPLFGRFMEILQGSLPDETNVAIRGSTVTGYNHVTGAPFDASGKGSSDLDLVLMGETVISYWREDGFYIPGVLTMPVGEENPGLAPALEPLCRDLQELVERPVHMQAMPHWFLELRRALLKTPYLLLDK
jgi:hypothetical protein